MAKIKSKYAPVSTMDDKVLQIRIERPLYDQDQLRAEYNYEKHKKNYIRDTLCNCEVDIKKTLSKTIPVIGWLSHYKWKEDFLSDLISGITVAIMHIPQGMGYGMLGNVPPVIGIYMAFFPVLVYFFLGTSRHNSMGTFSVVCLMTGKAVLEHSDPNYYNHMDAGNGTEYISDTSKYPYTPIQVATTVTFTVGLFHLAMYFLRLGFISALLSETLVSGFTTGAAVQVVVSQVKDLLGLKIPRHKGYFVVINTIISIFQSISRTNLIAVMISAITIVITVINNEWLKPKVSKISSFPVPIELIAIIIGTAASYFMGLKENYAIRVVDNIPSGLPVPELPQFDLISSVLLDGFTIAIVSYTISLSMALIFAQKLDYEVDANQEFLAQGTGNIVGSFFSCMPFVASLSRTTIQQTVGGKTQIASMVSCTILLFILLYVGPLFEPLPRCVLASVIVVALKGMLWQVKEFFYFLKFSKLDAIVWLTTFLTVIFVGVDIGLVVGIVMSLITIFIFSFKPYTCLLGSVANTDLYLDIEKYKGAKEITGLKIFHYCGGLNFATRSIFRSEILRLLDINPQKQLKYKTKLNKLDKVQIKLESNPAESKKIDKLLAKLNTEIKCIILDFSSLSYIDPSAVAMLKSLTESFHKIDMPIYIAGSSEPVYEMMSKCNLFTCKRFDIKPFATVHDAVQSATEVFHLTPVLAVSHM